MKQTPNAQRPTLNAQFRVCAKLSVGRWALNVGRWTFAVFSMFLFDLFASIRVIRGLISCL